MPLRPKFRVEMVHVVKAFIRDSLNHSGMNGVIIGLSGGLDSSVLSKLAVDALGPEKVYGMFLPDSSTPAQDREDAESFAENLELGLRPFRLTVR